ncbi:MAG TPA: hypothetical protein VGJ61_03600 [Solirubrobacterales bacterium]
MRKLILALLAAAIAGCGSSSNGDRSTAPPASAQATTTSPATAGLAPPCSRRARAAVERVAGSPKAQPFTSPSLAAACRLEAGPLTVIARLDSAPQPYTRLERQVVEYGQNVLHSGRRSYPQSIKRLGLDADWLAAEDRLLTTDGVRLIDVKVRWRSASEAASKALAIRLARVYLGPLRKPPGY